MLTVSLNFSLILKEEEEESHKGKPSRVIPSDWPKKKTKLLPLPAATRLVIKGLKCLHCSEKLNCNLLLYLNNDPTAKKNFNTYTERVAFFFWLQVGRAQRARVTGQMETGSFKR